MPSDEEEGRGVGGRALGYDLRKVEKSMRLAALGFASRPIGAASEGCSGCGG